MTQQHSLEQDGRQDTAPLRWRLGERPLQVAYILVWVLTFVAAGFMSAGTSFAPFFRNIEHVSTASVTAKPPLGDPPVLASDRGVQLPAKVVGEHISLWRDGRFVPMFLAGVNLGSSVPGHDPGALAATRADFDRWFTGMGELGVTVVRVYTIQSPAFYLALRDYNLRHGKQPLMLLHGVWIPEDRWYETGNAFDPEVMREMRRELTNAVGAVHGTARIPRVPGHAHGQYQADVSPWLLGWSFGIEWDPGSVMSTNRLNAGYRGGSGRYIQVTPAASPMERWIAHHLDILAGLEVARGLSVPLTFTNWDTTDPLEHPNEPFIDEDAVGLDAMHMRATASWPGGYFASIHAYPYYPDFMTLEADLLNYRRRRDGAFDPYAGYIDSLKRHFAGIPLMVTEVGQPSALGCAHRAQLGRDQGCMSEQEAATNLVDMMQDVRDEGGAGALAFMWLDEWFKFTWNTIDYELPSDRRSMWRNPLTNEEHFGLVAAEPGPQREIVVDGAEGDWTNKPILATASGAVREVRATSDAENVYLRLKVERNLWMRSKIVIGLDAHAAGNGGLPGAPGVDRDADVAVVIQPGGTANILHAGFVDAIGMRYGGFANPEERYVSVRRQDLRPGSGRWAPLRQLLSYPYRIPSTGRMRPADIVDSSRLPWGSADPASPIFDARNLIFGKDDVLEVAIPWGMMTFSDPSSHKVYELRLVPDAKRQVVARPIDTLGISILTGDQLVTTTGYSWDGWDSVSWHERRKAGWPTLQRAFARWAQPGPVTRG